MLDKEKTFFVHLHYLPRNSFFFHYDTVVTTYSLIAYNYNSFRQITNSNKQFTYNTISQKCN